MVSSIQTIEIDTISVNFEHLWANTCKKRKHEVKERVDIFCVNVCVGGGRGKIKKQKREDERQVS